MHPAGSPRRTEIAASGWRRPIAALSSWSSSRQCASTLWLGPLSAIGAGVKRARSLAAISSGIAARMRRPPAAPLCVTRDLTHYGPDCSVGRAALAIEAALAKYLTNQSIVSGLG